MQPEIQRLIDHPELLRETLHLDELDRIIHSLLPELDFQMKYTITSNHRGEPRFDADCDQDLVPHAGIFNHLLVKCRLTTFSQCVGHHVTEGYRCWFTLHLDYKHYDGGENGMQLAEFWFGNGKWEVKDKKDSRHR